MVSAFDGALMKNVNSSAGKFGAKGLTVCNRVCEVLSGMLANARDYAMCAAADLDNPGGGRLGGSRFEVGPARTCPPRHPTHSGSSLFSLNDIL